MDITVKKRFDRVAGLIKVHRLDAFYCSSFDTYLNEYTQKQECHRFLVSGFSGSTGEALVTGDRVRVYVDGRYHEQADKECDPRFVDVVKCSFEQPNVQAMCDDIKALGVTTLGVESGRTPLNLWRRFEQLCSLKPFDANIFEGLSPATPTAGEVGFLEERFTGEDSKTKIGRILKPGQSLFVSKLDSLCWALNLQGFQLPFHSVAKARAIVSSDKVVLIVPEDSKVTDEVSRKFSLVRCCDADYPRLFQRELERLDADEIFYSPSEISALDAHLLKQHFKGQVSEYEGLIPFQSVKNSVEITSFESSFEKADRAIFKTLLWLKQKAPGGRVSEKDFQQKTEENYRLQGAKTQSFNTIAGFGKNASVIHYGNPQDDCYLKEGETALLDSGGIFEEGLATDCTRTVLGYGQASDKHKLIYTLVLIGFIRIHRASFKRGTLGKELDALGRQAMKAQGFDYAHGTGHGVGINVHEGGFSLSPGSTVPLEKGKVGSIEPGIYLPGFGGVRLENVAVVEDDPTKKGYLRFRPFVFIGLEHGLIDYDLLDNGERQWTFDYEGECAQRGRSFYHA